LAVLNQRLRNLDVFEPNGSTISPRSSSARRGSRQEGSPARAAIQEVKPVDPDELVDQSHWQRPSQFDECTDPQCGRRLGNQNGMVNCRHCGNLFCEEHTMYQMKLSRSAQHEPVRGYWCRVCETCYKSRPGYNDHTGLVIDNTNEFQRIRQNVVDKHQLEVGRLERRLTRLTQLLANPPPPETDQSPGKMLWASFAGNKNHIRTLEQSIVTWEEDTTVSHCPFCQQAFSQYSFRRHHCRICGRVVCADPETLCSVEVALNVNSSQNNNQEDKSTNTTLVPVDVRMCRDCQHTIFSKADFAREIAEIPPIQKAYQNLCQFQSGIILLQPKFQRLLQALQDPAKIPTSSQLSDASKVRKRLTDAFTQYDVAARRIRDLRSPSETQTKLQKSIHAHATSFLHLHMLPLKSLPKIMRQGSSVNGSPRNNHLGSPLAVPNNDNSNNGYLHARRDSNTSTSTNSVVTTPNLAVVSALEGEEAELKQKLIVLEEQKFMVSSMVVEAKKKRRFDEVAALSRNIDDLDMEIQGLQSKLGGMDFEQAYFPSPL